MLIGFLDCFCLWAYMNNMSIPLYVSGALLLTLLLMICLRMILLSNMISINSGSVINVKKFFNFLQ